MVFGQNLTKKDALLSSGLDLLVISGSAIFGQAFGGPVLLHTAHCRKNTILHDLPSNDLGENEVDGGKQLYEMHRKSTSPNVNGVEHELLCNARLPEGKRPVTLKQNRAILHPMMLVSIAIWESGDAKSPRIARCRIARPAVISIAWFCIKRFLYSFSKECIPATHGSAKFVHRCLALTTPVLPAVSFRRIRQVERRFFFFASITLTLFEKPKQQNQEKCRGGYFRRDNRDHWASSRIPDRPNLNFDRSRMVLPQECFGNHYLSEFRRQTGRQ